MAARRPTRTSADVSRLVLAAFTVDDDESSSSDDEEEIISSTRDNILPVFVDKSNIFVRVHQDNSAVQGPSNDNTHSNDESSSDSSLLENDDDSDEPGQVQANATSKTPDTEVWEKIEILQNDSRKLNFDFKHAKVPGLQVNLNSDGTPLQCFFELFTDEVQDALIQFISLIQ